MPTTMTNTTEDKASPLASQRPRLLHTMVRVANLEASLEFYIQKLGMQLLRYETYPEGRFTLAFVGYGEEAQNSVIELTHNWEGHDYDHGSAYGHIAIAVTDAAQVIENLRKMGVTIAREAGAMRHGSPERAAKGLDYEIIAFVKDPDGYRIEIIQTPMG